MVWEWLLFLVGTAIYFFSCLFYWVFRRLRRRFYEKEARRYQPECFQPNRTFLEFVLDYKTKKTKAIEAKLQKTETEQMLRCQLEAS